MRQPLRNLEAAGEAREDVADRVMRALGRGMVLHLRKVTSGTGMAARCLTQQHVVMKPSIVDGLIVALIEDEETDAVNTSGRHRYGIRPKDVSSSMLRRIAPDVMWLGAAGVARMTAAGHPPTADLWRKVRPAALNLRPGIDGGDSREEAVGIAAAPALRNLRKGSREAIAALVDGLHLVDVLETQRGKTGPAEHRIWKPLRPQLDADGTVMGYASDARVMRHTANAGRTGFTMTTFAAISPLLVEAGYDPVDGDRGHAYKLSGEHAAAALEAIDWLPETDQAPAEFHSRDGTRTPPEPTPREQAIIDMLEGREVRAVGRAPTYAEVAAAIALHSGDHDRTAALIEAAMVRTAANAQAGRPARPWWRITSS